MDGHSLDLVANATVSISDGSGKRIAATTRTDFAGRYRIDNDAAIRSVMSSKGRIRVSINKSGYETRAWLPTVGCNNTVKLDPDDSSTPDYVSQSPLLPSYRPSNAPKGSYDFVGGRVVSVVNDKIVPVGGAIVSVQDYDTLDGKTPYAITDANGHFLVSGMKIDGEQQVKLVVRKRGYHTSMSDPTGGNPMQAVKLEPGI